MSRSLSANSSSEGDTSTTVSEFEEELVSDDLFLSYFNAFLRLPIFSQKLCYERLSGAFQPVQTTEMQTPEYGLSDRERESIIEWAKSERYVPFKRSDYYRELKLCRLLRCPTEFIPGGKELLAPKVFGDLFHSGNTSAIRGLAGVSRQSSFAHDTESMEECSEMTEESDLTGGSEVSRGTPSEQQQSFDDLWIQEDKGRKRDHTYGKYFKIRRQTVPGSPEQFSPVLESRLSGKANNIPEYVVSAGSVGKSRRMSDPVLVQRGTSSEKHRRSPENPQTDDSNHFKRAECWVQRKEAEKSTSDSFVTATESELVQQLGSFQKRQHIPFQRLKELLLSSRDGMRDFISFLGPTKGLSLVDFWLDCEETTMSVAHLQISERLRTKFQLLRELEDRYILRLTPKVRRHLELAIDTLSNEIVKNCQSDEDHLTQRIGELMFERIQYDSLRRLRSYWLPSWILHWESRLKRCQFLPSGHGGCQLFYIPPKRFKTSRSELQEGGFNDALTGFSDENINGLPDEKKEEQDWDKEVSEQILAKALSGTGLFGVKESRKVLRESRTSRVYLTATSALDSIPESRVGGLLREYTPKICDVETKKEVFDEIHLGSAVSWESAEVFGCMDVSSNAKQRRKSICSSRNNLPESVTLQTPYKKQNVSNRKSISAQEWRAFRILLMDSAAGGPLQLYLERSNMVREHNALGFLQSIQELTRQNLSSMPNRLKRLNDFLRILRTFLLPGAPRNIAMPLDLVEEVKSEVRVKRYQTTEKVFARLARACLELLLPAWIAFLKYDAFEYAKASHRHYDAFPPPQSMDEFDVIFDGSAVVIKRRYPEVQKMASQISPWAALPPEERRVYARIALEKRRFMEKARKLAVKTAIRRQKEEQKKKQKPRSIGIRRVPQILIKDGADEGSGALEQPEDGVRREPPSIKKFLTNKSLLKSFQLWLADQQGSREQKKEVEMYKQLIRQLSYVIESSRFLAMSTRRVTTEYLDSKCRLAEAIYQTYLQKGASQRIPVANKYVVNMSKEKGRPSSGTFRGIREDQFRDLDPHFLEFLKFLADKFGMTLFELADLSEEDIIELLEAQEDKTLKGATGHVFCRAHPTAEDLAAFEAMLASVAFRPLTFEVILFYQFLVNNACRRGETFADQDFIFCIEAVRYQELCRGKICNSVLKKKVNCILLTFVDTPFLTKLQVDLPHAFSSILVQQVKRALDAKTSLPPDIYEEAKHRLTQEILPFWAGFRRNVLLQGKPMLGAPGTGTKGVENIFRIPPFSTTSAHRQHSGDQYHGGDSMVTRLEYSLPDLPSENRANMINFSVKNGAQWGYFEEW